ncbi:MAG TPA: AMP-dependent synthetase, partial [Thermosulfidibacter takaii]|nr:AMP-dependent synthetase [Thermosulfidibacter takaii]
WDERPLACVVLKEGEKEESKKEEILESLSNRFPKWWLPDEILFVDEIPKTSVGKFDKKVLRKKFGDYYMGK